MALSRPSMCGTRPAYLDNLFRDTPPALPTSPSTRSANSSVSYSSSSAVDLRVVQAVPRPLSPAFEEDVQDDGISIRSLKLNFSPRLNFRNMLNRRTYPQVKETMEYTSSTSTPAHSQPPSRRTSVRSARSLRRPSLPKLQTSFTSPPRKGHPITSKPLPAAPVQQTELKCQPCYYFTARNCNGYVFGGSHGDACENCAVSISVPAE